MEILIPGLLLVGFMVWASTRIKRNAARAFEKEEIETGEYSITKPEGFLSLVDPPEGLLLSAYSKEFGRDGAERVRQATVELRRFPNTPIDDVIERAKNTSANPVSEQTGVIGGRKCANIVVERFEQDVPLESHHKIVADRDSVYQLTVNVLPAHKDELQPRIDQLLNSFSLN